MKTLSIDFAPSSLRRSLRRIHPLAWLILLLALSLALATLLNAQKLRQQQQEMELLVNHLIKEMQIILQDME